MKETNSPILVGVYTRIDHLKKSIESLQRCEGAKDSVIYIASDCASTNSDVEMVQDVRNYILQISGFKSVIPIFREKNLGGDLNYREALTQIFNSYDRVILMEDDVIVGSGFIKFMNSGLSQYAENKEVLGVSAYLPPGIFNPKGVPFFLRMMNPYGMGLWRDRFELIENKRTPEFMDECFKNYPLFRIYEKNAPHVARALPLIIKGGKSFGDIEIELIMHAMKLVVLYPPMSISMNIGNDGTGAHSGINPELQRQVISDQIYSVSDLRIELADDIQFKVCSDRRHYLHRPINYLIFFCHKYIPGYFYFFKLFRDLVRLARFAR